MTRFLLKKKSKRRRRSRGSKRSTGLGEIEDLGFLYKIVNWIFFCLDSDTRLGVFLLVSAMMEMVGLLSETSNIWLMMKTGFAVQAVLLLLVKALGANC